MLVIEGMASSFIDSFIVMQFYKNPKKSDTIKAIEFYKKALDINPENSNAKRAYKKLTKNK